MDIFQTIQLNNLDKFKKEIAELNLNILNEFKQNLLHEAISNSSVEIGHYLIERGINVNHQETRGQTPLHYTALYNRFELAKHIIEAGGNVNLCDVYGNNALWTATFNARGKYEIVKLFIESGGDPHNKNKNNKSPLDFAEQIKDKELVNILKSRFRQ